MVRARVGFLLGVLFCLGCATTFPYEWFGVRPLEGKPLQGTLVGDKPENDEDLDFACGVYGACVVIKTAEFKRMRLDRDRLIVELKKCQQPD